MLKNYAQRAPYTFLTLLCVITVFSLLSLSLFNTRGEPREAVVALSMINDGNWILPVNNGNEIAFKPPFLHWLAAAASLLLGGMTELSARLPSALACWVMVLATYAFFRRRGGHEVAMLASLLCLTCFEVHRAAMTCRVDMLLAACTVLALYAFARWVDGGLRGFPLAAAAFAACAALTKGPVGALLPCAAGFLYAWFRGGKLKHLVWRFALIGVSALVPLFAWYAAAYAQPHGGERFLRLVYEENVLRLLGKMTYASHENPWWYNVQTMLTGLLPYSLLLVFALPAGAKAVWRNKGAWTEGGAPAVWYALREQLRRCNFAAVAFFTVFVFYCIPASKRSVYLLPCYPFAAYYLARIIRRFSATPGLRGLVKVLIAVLMSLCVLLAVLVGVVQSGVFADDLSALVNVGRHGAENAAYLAALSGFSLASLTALLPLGVCAWWLAARRPVGGAWCVAPVVAVFFVLDSFVLPAIKAVKSDRPVAEEIARLVPPDALLLTYRADQVAGNRMHPFTINFYLDNRLLPVDTHQAPFAEAYLITGNDEIEAFKKAYPAFDVQLVLDTHHRSCDDSKIVKLHKITRRTPAKE